MQQNCESYDYKNSKTNTTILTTYCCEDSYCYGCSKYAIYKTRKCAGCRKVRYCSRECQQTAWEDHQPLCIAAENPGFIDIPFSAAINKLYQAESDRLDATCMILYQQYQDATAEEEGEYDEDEDEMY